MIFIVKILKHILLCQLLKEYKNFHFSFVIFISLLYYIVHVKVYKSGICYSIYMKLYEINYFVYIIYYLKQFLHSNV